jgi:hypothetical protein
MYVSVKKIITDGKLGRWLKLSDEEVQYVVESIPGENMVRNASLSNFGYAGITGNNLRHYLDRGYIVVLDGTAMEAEKHPLDKEKEIAPGPALAQGLGEENVSVKSEPGVFVAAV